MRRRAFGVAAQLQQALAAGDVPEAADHVVADTGKLAAVGRDRELTQLARRKTNGRQISNRACIQQYSLSLIGGDRKKNNLR